MFQNIWFVACPWLTFFALLSDSIHSFKTASKAH